MRFQTNLFSVQAQYAVRRVIEAIHRWSQEISFMLGAAFRQSVGLTTAARSFAAVIRETMDADALTPAGQLGLTVVSRQVYFIGS